MLPQRRIKLLAIAALALVIMVMYYSSDARGVQNQKFYQSTVAAIEAHTQTKEPGVAAGSSPDEQRLSGNPTHGDAAKPADDQMAPAIPRNGDEETEEISIAGRTKMTVPKDRNNPERQVQGSGTDERVEAKTELNSILKRSPIIIFSKSYCPHSARAKSILLDRYSIVPAPYVLVEEALVAGMMWSLSMRRTSWRQHLRSWEGSGSRSDAQPVIFTPPKKATGCL
ncbi:hypothetical protein RU639_008418 [Aspergillus parasiticus]